mmetsp:Transcript_10403/g.24094  ORF Transcript_10403/g.24094 Transcript_10403/m.24094 type:complete len:238 (-) Transcript_10403:1202-1915(-)
MQLHVSSTRTAPAIGRCECSGELASLVSQVKCALLHSSFHRSRALVPRCADARGQQPRAAQQVLHVVTRPSAARVAGQSAAVRTWRGVADRSALRLSGHRIPVALRAWPRLSWAVVASNRALEPAVRILPHFAVDETVGADVETHPTDRAARPLEVARRAGDAGTALSRRAAAAHLRLLRRHRCGRALGHAAAGKAPVVEALALAFVRLRMRQVRAVASRAEELGVGQLVARARVAG